MRNESAPIYVISGGRGIAGHTMVHSLIIQYPDNNIPVNIIPNVQSVEKIKEVVTLVKEKNGLLTHTMVNSELRQELLKECENQQVPQVDFMGPLANFLEDKYGFKSVSVPGLYRRINSAYFDRVEAMEFTLNHDDGVNTNRLAKADIVLTGVSRSGKTPLSIYMSMYGWKVANVPLVSGIAPPEELFQIDAKRVFGLSISPSHLISQRYKRLQNMGFEGNEMYVDDKLVREEIRNARFQFERGGFTVINVTNKPIETSANEIIGYVADRFDYKDRRRKSPEEKL